MPFQTAGSEKALLRRGRLSTQTLSTGRRNSAKVWGKQWQAEETACRNPEDRVTSMAGGKARGAWVPGKESRFCFEKLFGEGVVEQVTMHSD